MVTTANGSGIHISLSALTISLLRSWIRWLTEKTAFIQAVRRNDYALLLVEKGTTWKSSFLDLLVTHMLFLFSTLFTGFELLFLDCSSTKPVLRSCPGVVSDDITVVISCPEEGETFGEFSKSVRVSDVGGI